jgi:hypothetical protein
MLEDMRRALMQLLISEMEASFARAQERVGEDGEDAEATGEEELGSLVGEAVRTARRNARTPSKRKASSR